MERPLSVIITDCIEECRRDSREKFIDEMSQVHPTLQQVFAGLVFGWFNAYAEYRSDDRNEASVEFTRELRDLYRDAACADGFKDKFPFI